MSEGWFCLHRGWRDNPLFKGEFSRADAWVWLIENAAWKPNRARIKGETVEIQRGEMSFSQRFLAEKWGWSKSRVDRFIADLRDENMIETRSKIGATNGHKAGQGQSILTICNYAKYQDVMEGQRGNDTPHLRGNSGATAGQQRGKEEQGNKETREDRAYALPSQNAGASECVRDPDADPQDGNPEPAAKVKPHRMPADWSPSPLPAPVAKLVALWPEGRLEREADNCRDYWLDRTEKRPGWDRTFHNRIRQIHDQVLREASNANRQAAWGNSASHRAGPDHRDGRTRAIHRELEREMGFGQPAEPPAAAGRRDGGEFDHGGYLAAPRP